MGVWWRRRRRLWWRVVLGTVGVLLIAMGVHLMWLQRQIDREIARIHAAHQPVTLAELSAWYAKPTGPNAATAYRRAFDAYASNPALEQQLPPFTGKSWPAPSQPLPASLAQPAERYLTLNAQALAHLRTASTIKACRFPTQLDRGMKAELKHLEQLRYASKLLCMKAELAADRNQPEQFVEAIDQMVALGDALRRSRCSCPISCG